MNLSTGRSARRLRDRARRLAALVGGAAVVMSCGAATDPSAVRPSTPTSTGERSPSTIADPPLTPSTTVRALAEPAVPVFENWDDLWGSTLCERIYSGTFVDRSSDSLSYDILDGDTIEFEGDDYIERFEMRCDDDLLRPTDPADLDHIGQFTLFESDDGLWARRSGFDIGRTTLFEVRDVISWSDATRPPARSRREQGVIDTAYALIDATVRNDHSTIAALLADPVVGQAWWGTEPKSALDVLDVLEEGNIDLAHQLGDPLSAGETATEVLRRSFPTVSSYEPSGEILAAIRRHHPDGEVIGIEAGLGDPTLLIDTDSGWRLVTVPAAWWDDRPRPNVDEREEPADEG